MIWPGDKTKGSFLATDALQENGLRAKKTEFALVAVDCRLE